MAVEISEKDLFEQIGRLYIEAKMLNQHRAQLEEAVKLLRGELEKKNKEQAKPRNPKGGK